MTSKTIFGVFTHRAKYHSAYATIRADAHVDVHEVAEREIHPRLGAHAEVKLALVLAAIEIVERLAHGALPSDLFAEIASRPGRMPSENRNPVANSSSWPGVRMVIAKSATAPKPSELAVGISQALITTLIGLWLAIPAIACFALFKNWLQKLNGDVDGEAMRLMSRFQTMGKK